MVRLVCMSALGAISLLAQWPQFRGPNGMGVSDAGKLPVEFGPAKNVIWKAEVPAGHSSPIISGNRIFITAAEGGAREQRGPRVIDTAKLVTICLDRGTGKILWKREAPRPRAEVYQPTNSPASPSPVTDGKTVYVFFGDFGVIAYSVEGAERWRLPLGPFNNPNGHGSSPVIVDNLLILLCDDDSASYLLALDKETGRVKWKTTRPEVTRSYSTPGVVRSRRGPVELIIPGSYRLDAYNAHTGEKLWWIGGMSWQPKSVPVVDGDVVYAHWWENGGEAEQPTETPTFVDTLAKFDTDKDGKLSRDEFAPDPRLQRGFVDNDLAGDGFVDERDWSFYVARRSSRNALLAVRAGKRGDLTGSSEVLWRMQKFLPNTPAPLLYQGVMYLIKDGGILTTLNPKTGEILKQGRLTGALDTYYASPVAGAGHVYVISNPGKITVLKASPQWEIVSMNDLDDICFATPAIADNKLYVRTRSTLYAFGTE
jgi:outer membrane protein assembly factor BamB